MARRLAAGLVGEEPDTACGRCWRAEARLVRRLVVGRPPAAALQDAYLDLVGSWYARHREDWVRTGDEQHLVRMLRHVA